MRDSSFIFDAWVLAPACKTKAHRCFPSQYALGSTHVEVVGDEQWQPIHSTCRLVDHIRPVRADARPAHVSHRVTAVVTPPVARKVPSAHNVPSAATAATVKIDWRVCRLKSRRRCAEPIHCNDRLAGCFSRREVVIEHARERRAAHIETHACSAREHPKQACWECKQRMNVLYLLSQLNVKVVVVAESVAGDDRSRGGRLRW
eukprot:COSAG06_NODE_1743_length_8502_cov_6.160757_1_plen_203_part_00